MPLPNPFSVPAPQQTGFSGLLNKAKGALTSMMGDQFNRAGAHYAMSRRVEGQNPLMAGIGAAGQLNTTTRGIGGGALGAMGAAALSPRGTRGFMMPLATGLGAAMSVANGPDGFKMENLMKPEALIAGGIGAGAGLLGHHLLGGDDDEEDDDPSGLSGHAPKHRSGGSWLPTLGALGAAGLGGYGLYKYMNQPASVPAASKGADSAAMGAGAGAINAPVVTTSGPTTSAQPAAPAVPPAAPPPPAAAPAAPAAAPPQALKGQAAMQRFTDNPQATIADIQQYGNLAASRDSLKNLVGQYQQAEAGVGNPNNFPVQSDIYRRIYSGETGLLDRAKGYQAALDQARQAAQMGEWAPLNRLEALRKIDVGGLPGGPAIAAKIPKEGFGIGGLDALGAFGYKNIDHLAQAAADGDPQVSAAIHAMGPVGQRDLLNALTKPGYAAAQSQEGKLGLPAIASNPRAAALLGAVQAAATGKPLEAASYDPSALLSDPDSLRSTLTPAQKMKLIQDVRNPDALEASLQGMSPAQRQLAARNLGNLLSREAQGYEVGGGSEGPAVAPKWMDENVQSAMARLAGQKNYSPVALQHWRDMAAQGLDSGASLSPYKDQEGNYRMPEDIEAQRLAGPGEHAGYDPANIVLGRNPEQDQLLKDQWTKALSSNVRRELGDRTGLPDDKQLGPLAVQLERLARYRPELYDKIVNDLQQQHPRIPGAEEWPIGLIPSMRNIHGDGADINAINWARDLQNFRTRDQSLNHATGRYHLMDGSEATPRQLPGWR